MSYILDALRKSESERHQGKVPDLGRQLQFIPRPAKRHWPVQALLAAGLLLNAGVLVYVLWPDQGVAVVNTSVPEQALAAPAITPVTIPVTTPAPATVIVEPVLPGSLQSAFQSPTVIVPSDYGNSGTLDGNRNSQGWDEIGGLAPAGAKAPAGSIDGVRVPHLVELPLSFQRSVPDLTVNSHIFASVPQARRVMINNQNLRPGDSFQGLRVEEITEDGVVLSRQGQQFRLGIVRDWMSPR
ncbi:MAG: general secretion pathway protein GspB [Marinobacter sp.]